MTKFTPHLKTYHLKEVYFDLLKKWINFDTLKKYTEKTQYFRHIP